MRIALTGGGTGGHLFPLVAVAREIKKSVQQNIFQISPGEGITVDFMFLGPETIGEETLAQEGIIHKKILAGKWRRYASGLNIIDALKVPIGLIQSLWHLFFFMPNVVFSKGGFGSVPVVIAAWFWRIPVLVHESDTIPGLANRICAKFAARIAISFTEASQYFPAGKTALTGNPIRATILGGTKEEAVKLLNLIGVKPVLFIYGGSLGSQAINNEIIAALPLLLARVEIIHQCGTKNYEEVKKAAAIAGNLPADYHLLPFLNENQVKAAYAAADLIIARAGASNIAEIAAIGKPSILIPLANSASNHQNENAMAFARSGAAEIIEQANLTPHLFQNIIFHLLDNPLILQKMSLAAQNFSQPQAAQKIAQELLNIAKW